MLVKNWMSKQVVVVDAKDSMDAAIKKIKENGVHMLPVLDKGRLAGVLTDRDLKRASASDATTLEIHELIYLLSKIKVREIMSKNPITVRSDQTIEETAEILMQNDISGAPVVNEKGDVVGVITKSDIFRLIVSLSGMGKRGCQLAILARDESGSIKKVTDRLRSHGARVASILSTTDGAPEGWRSVYLRIYGIAPATFWALRDKDLAELDVKPLYMVDFRDNRREIME